jgi:hypothetical protein
MMMPMTEILGLKPLTSGHSSCSFQFPPWKCCTRHQQCLPSYTFASGIISGSGLRYQSFGNTLCCSSHLQWYTCYCSCNACCLNAGAPTIGPREMSPSQAEQSPPMREMSQLREQLNQQQLSPWEGEYSRTANKGKSTTCVSSSLSSIPNSHSSHTKHSLMHHENVVLSLHKSTMSHGW